MTKTLQEYFQGQRVLTLNKQSKVRLFHKIQSKVQQKTGISRAIMMRAKVLSMVLIMAFSFSFLQYLNLPNQNISNLLAKLRSSNTASADYLGTVISWDGSYKIILNNKVLTDKDKDRHIPDGGELVLEKGSRISIKTNNQAQADVVGPAKIAFNKKDNQIIVDVKYSERVDIKQEKEQIQAQKSPENVSSVRESLVVRANNQTIVGKGDGMHIALVHQADSDKNVITNKDGDILITNEATKSVVELKANQIALLDLEVKLFANDAPDNTVLLAMDNTSSVYSSMQASDSVKTSDTIATTELVDIQSNVEDLLGKESQEPILAKSQDAAAEDPIGVKEANVVNSLMAVSNEEAVGDDEQATLRIDASQEDTSTVPVDVKAKTENLLQSKKILSSKALSLLDALYVNFTQNGMQQIVGSQDIIFQLCDELNIICRKKATIDDCMHDVRAINAKIVSKFIITEEVKLIR